MAMRMRENPRQLTVNVDANVTATGTATAMADNLAQNYVCLMIPGEKKKKQVILMTFLSPRSQKSSQISPPKILLQIPSTNQTRISH
jgi:hypothetical protein